ncbi:oligosaccharide flippase family protein, partial [Candidatus Peregrinibacteria bacterium]|nr:oligosaccharide flippase family protein [Candidatus Peregrinibacteria bacterium]
MSMARKILSNTFIQVAGKIAGALVSVAIVKLITNFLSVDGYGQYVAIFEFLAFFGIAADLGLFTIAVREMAKDEKKTEFIIGNILSLRFILSISTMSLAVLAAFLIPQYSDTFIPVGVA